MADQSPTGESAEMRRLRLSEGSPLIDALGEFVSDLDGVHTSWLHSTDLLSELQEKLFHARGRVKELVDSRIVSPAGQTGTQFAAGLLDLVEEAWHLCRFVFAIPQDANPKDADSKRLRKDMHERLPAIHDELRKAWLHLKHAESLGVSPDDCDPRHFSPAELRKVFGLGQDTLKKRLDRQTIRNIKHSTKAYQIHVDDLPKSKSK